MTVEIWLPMKKVPTATHQEKQVSCKSGKPVFYEPPRLTEARALLESKLAPYRPEQPLSGPLACSVKWLFGTKRKALHGQPRDTRPDCHNLNKLLFDVLTDLHFWKDDAQVVEEHIRKTWVFPDLHPAGIYLEIRQIGDYSKGA